MANNKFDRPTVRLQGYSATPQYVRHGADDDRLAILTCRIKTWKPNGTKWFDIPENDQCLVIREVESVEIANSYKELIGKATIKFPRGTIVEKRMTSELKVPINGVDNNGKAQLLRLDKATGSGDFLESYMQRLDTKKVEIENVTPTSTIVSLDGSQVDTGLTQINQHLNEKMLLNPNDFAIGNRIEVYLGYAYSEEEFKSMQNDNNKVPVNMEMVFTGFVTKCSVATPLEVECENMARVFSTVNVPDIKTSKTLKVNDFLDDNGLFHLLKGTGISMSYPAGNYVIEVGKLHIGSHLTVADVLSEWSKAGIMAFMENNTDGTSTLRVGKVYYTGKGGSKMPTNDPNYITYTKNTQYNVIQFDWDVAEDRLELMHTDKKYLAVNAQARDSKNRYFKLTVRKADNATNTWETTDGDFNDDSAVWSVVNEKMPTSKKKGKKKGGTSKASTTPQKQKVSMRNFMVIPYISQTVPCTKEQLLREAKQYWNSYVPNGISGALTIFGDLHINPSDIVALIDPRQPQKNGYYLVESVNISFGTNGYRKELKIPYKIMNFKNFPTYKL